MIKFISLHLKFQLTDQFRDQAPTLSSPPSEERVENLASKEEPLTLEVNHDCNKIDTVLQSLKQGVPGPGNYNPKLGIDKVGRYTLSKFR